RNAAAGRAAHAFQHGRTPGGVAVIPVTKERNHVIELAWLAWPLGLVGLVSSLGMYSYIRKQPAGNDVMRGLAAQIETGAMAFLRREYSVLAVFIVVVGGLLWWAIGMWSALAFLAGALSS